MKNKPYDIIIIALILIISACSKKDNESTTEPSEAVKYYFNLVQVAEDNANKRSVAPGKSTAVHPKFARSADSFLPEELPCDIFENTHTENSFEFWWSSQGEFCCNDYDWGTECIKGEFEIYMEYDTDLLLMKYDYEFDRNGHCEISTGQFSFVADGDYHIGKEVSTYGSCDAQIHRNVNSKYQKLPETDTKRNHMIYVEKSGDVSYTDRKYQSSLLEPTESFGLVINDETNEIQTYVVRGVEKVVYNQNGTIGEFIIDYGNGEMDNLVTVYENGVSYVLNIEELSGKSIIVF